MGMGKEGKGKGRGGLEGKIVGKGVRGSKSFDTLQPKRKKVKSEIIYLRGKISRRTLKSDSICIKNLSYVKRFVSQPG